MSNYFRFLCFVIVLAILPAHAALAQTKGSPKMVIEKKVHDFGTVAEGQNLKYTFKVINRGDEPLRINSVRPD